MRKNVFLPLGAIALLTAGLLTSPLAAAADPAVTSINPVTAMGADEKPTGPAIGTSQLVREDTGLTLTLTTTKLTPLNVYTAWWVISGADGKMLIVSYASAAIALPDGTAAFGGRLPLGPVAAADGKTVLVNDAPNKMLSSSRGITVAVVLRDHGPMRVVGLLDQLTTYEADCKTCTDPQISIHAP